MWVPPRPIHAGSTQAEPLPHHLNRIFQREMTEEQLQYMQYMVDPKGDLQFSLDEVLLAFRWVVKGPRCMRCCWPSGGW